MYVLLFTQMFVLSQSEGMSWLNNWLEFIVGHVLKPINVSHITTNCVQRLCLNVSVICWTSSTYLACLRHHLISYWLDDNSVTPSPYLVIKKTFKTLKNIQRSYEIINESYFCVSATKIGENTANIFNCCFSQ